jgi:hypothetical protein
MSTVKTSGFIDGIKGRMHGDVFQYNQGGLVMRGTKVYCRTAMYTVKPMIAIFPTVTAAWRGLSVADRALWALYATHFTVATKFGVNRIPSGYNLFCACNGRLAFQAYPLFTSPSGSPYVPAPNNFLCTDTSASLMQLKWAHLTSGTDIMVWSCTPPMSPGRQTPIGYWRTCISFSAFDFVSFDFGGIYAALFGTPLAGLQVAFRNYVLDINTGVRSDYSQSSFILT